MIEWLTWNLRYKVLFWSFYGSVEFCIFAQLNKFSSMVFVIARSNFFCLSNIVKAKQSYIVNISSSFIRHCYMIGKKYPRCMKELLLAEYYSNDIENCENCLVSWTKLCGYGRFSAERPPQKQKKEWNNDQNFLDCWAPQEWQLPLLPQRQPSWEEGILLDIFATLVGMNFSYVRKG